MLDLVLKSIFQFFWNKLFKNCIKLNFGGEVSRYLARLRRRKSLFSPFQTLSHEKNDLKKWVHLYIHLLSKFWEG